MEEVIGPLQDIFKDFRTQWKAFQEAEPFLDVLRGFINAIDWREPWIVAIMAFHAIMFVTAVLMRKRTNVQLLLACIAGAVTFNAERLNRLGAQHWETFASQKYFDHRGVFMSAVVSGPQLLVMFVVLVNYLISCAGMLVEAKKRELIYKAKQRAKQAKTAEVSGGNKKED